MVRRSFRRGLRIGILAGIGFAVAKLMRTWRAVEEPAPSLPTPAPWPPAQPKPAAKADVEPKAAAAPVDAPPKVDAPPAATQEIAPKVEQAAEPPTPPAEIAPKVEQAPDTPAATAVPDAGPGGAVKEPGKRQRPPKATTGPGRSTKKAAKKAAEPTAAPAPPARGWVEPSGSVCPPEHPVKAKLSSKLFHLPGMFAYDRCKPDRCYADQASAEADGLTKAKR